MTLKPSARNKHKTEQRHSLLLGGKRRCLLNAFGLVKMPIFCQYSPQTPMNLGLVSLERHPLSVDADVAVLLILWHDTICGDLVVSDMRLIEKRSLLY